MFTAAFRFKHQNNLAAMVKRFRQDVEATAAMKRHLAAIDELKALNSSRKKSDPENLLDDAVLLVRDNETDADGALDDEFEQTQLEGGRQILVTQFLKSQLPPHHHCIIKSLRVPFSRRVYAAKNAQLKTRKQTAHAFMNVGLKPSMVYYDTDMPLMEQVLKEFDEKITEFLYAEFHRATEIVRNLGSELGVVF